MAPSESPSRNSYLSLFNVPKGIYLLNHSVGCMPKKVEESFRTLSHEYYGAWYHTGSLAWTSWLQELEGFNKEIARLLNADPASFCPQSNVSSAMAKILSCLNLTSNRRKFVLSDMEFPSLGFVLAQGRKNFSNLEFVRNIDWQTPISEWKKFLNPSIKAVLVSHTTFCNSYLNPVSEICSLARKEGILSIVDCTQSVGVVPIDLAEWDADFVVGSCVKWLCGGTGAGFLWANPTYNQDLQPTDVGWFSHENPVEYDIEHFVYAKDARRFLGGTPSVGPFVTARHSLEVLNSIGIQTIRKHNLELTEILHDGLPQKDGSEHHFKILSPSEPYLRGGTICIQWNNPKNVVENLHTKNIFVDCREAYGVRMSPHIYNTHEEMETVLKACRSL